MTEGGRVADMVVVGAGVAGLACAWDACQADWWAAPREAPDGVSGRMRTGRRNGAVLGRGRQVCTTSYPQAKRHLGVRSHPRYPFTAGGVAPPPSVVCAGMDAAGGGGTEHLMAIARLAPRRAR